MTDVIAEARALILGLAKQPPALVQGWTYPAPNIGLFGQDYGSTSRFVTRTAVS